MASALQLVIVVVAAVFAVYYSGKGPILTRKVQEVIHGKSGCVPLPDITNVTLHYFGVRGRGESIRMILEDTNIVYKEVNFDSKTWPINKAKGVESGLFTFGQVPALEVSPNVHLSQSQAIVHYIGRATGLDCDCEDLHLCEVIALGVEDVKKQVSTVLYNPAHTVADRLKLLEETVPMWLGYFEKLASPLAGQGQSHFASGRLTWIDFLVFEMLEGLKNFALYDWGSAKVAKVDVLAGFPKLTGFYSGLVSSRPRLAAYLVSKRRFPFNVMNKPSDL